MMSKELFAILSGYVFVSLIIWLGAFYYLL